MRYKRLLLSLGSFDSLVFRASPRRALSKEVVMKTRVVHVASLAAAAVLAGCATTESFSYLEGQRYFRAPINTYDASIISVDGTHYLFQKPVRIEPGKRTIVVQAPPAAGFRQGEQRTLQVDIEPCKRYWFAAVKKTPLSQDFEPKIDYVEDIAGCGVKK
jgi:hypothetical protein